MLPVVVCAAMREEPTASHPVATTNVNNICTTLLRMIGASVEGGGTASRPVSVIA